MLFRSYQNLWRLLPVRWWVLKVDRAKGGSLTLPGTMVANRSRPVLSELLVAADALAAPFAVRVEQLDLRPEGRFKG